MSRFWNFLIEASAGSKALDLISFTGLCRINRQFYGLEVQKQGKNQWVGLVSENLDMTVGGKSPITELGPNRFFKSYSEAQHEIERLVYAHGGEMMPVNDEEE